MKKIKGNKGKFKLAVMVIVAVGLLTGCAYTTKDLNEQSVLAINWVQTSAEYRAISYQAYNLARMNLDNFLASYSGSKPVAISVDIDEVVFDNSAYQAWLIGQDFGYYVVSSPIRLKLLGLLRKTRKIHISNVFSWL